MSEFRTTKSNTLSLTVTSVASSKRNCHFRLYISLYMHARIKEKDPLAGKPIQFNKIVPPPQYAPKACESHKN